VRPLKVIHIIGGGEFGGAEKHILNLAGAVDRQAVELTVCCLFSAPFVEIASRAGIKTLALPMRNKADLSTPTALGLTCWGGWQPARRAAKRS
jgi:hypothetical protein